MRDDKLTIEQVLKKNFRERMKKEKASLDIIDELPSLIQRGYEVISEDDIVRLQWYGLYHNKPKIGEFMMRLKIPNGILTPKKLATIGELAERFGKGYGAISVEGENIQLHGYGEITTRQDIQLHAVRLEHLPDVFATLKQAGLSTVGACGDVVRNITGCPVAGIDRQELFDVRPVVLQLAQFLDGNREYSDLPRKHKITVAACPSQCNLPEIHCQAYIAVKHGERLGFAMRVGGGLSTVPRISKPLGVFVEVQDVLSVVRAILDVWKEDLNYRRSFIKARLKFMIDDLGVEEFRRRVEERLGRKLEDYPESLTPASETNHLGVHQQPDEALRYIGFPVLSGRITGQQMIQIAALAEREGGDIRLTQQQNLILANISKDRVDQVIRNMETVGFSLDGQLRGPGIACTGQPFCNFAVTETKGRLIDVVDHLEQTFGPSTNDLRIFLDGCPHACGHHWIGDIGLMGTTGRTNSGDKIEAYDVILRGGRGASAAIGKPLGRRIPAEQVKYAVERLVRTYRTEATNGGSGISFQQFCINRTDEELQAIMAG